ncbi:MAG: LCP family protein [Oscillospiraceae bacterium]|jgi:LCP family protein required for cell wall assembly|nr:LCP family protein [Oscillospiraceae bacterium]
MSKAKKVNNINRKRRVSRRGNNGEELSRAQRLTRRSHRRAILLCSVGAVAIALVAAAVIMFKPEAPISPSNGVRTKYYSYSQVVSAFAQWISGNAILPLEELEPTPTATPIQPDDNPGIYTFVVMALDDGNGNTDVIMVCALDTGKHTLNIVNVPRDTCVNISGGIRKANAIYAKRSGETDETRAQRVLGRDFRNLIGYEPDFYIVVSLQAFKELVDAVGGIDFYVPRNMNYDDPAQNLSIHITKGQHHLNGKDALGVVRFRQGNNNTGYASGDIGRIEMQQAFLKEASAQILAKKNAISLTKIIDLFLKYVKSASSGNGYGSLTTNNYSWLAAELFKIDGENVTFSMLPGNTGASINGDSYVTIYVSEWVEMIAEKLGHTVTADQLSILTRNGSGSLYVTDGKWIGTSSWGSGGGSSSSSTPRPSPSPTPTPDNTPSTSPSPTPTDDHPDYASPTPSAPSDDDPPIPEHPEYPTDPTPEAPATPDAEPAQPDPEPTDNGGFN